MFRSLLVRRLFWTFGLALGAMLPAHAAFPERPVTIIVPYPPGSAADVVTRMVAEEMQARLGQSFVVSNREGASGSIGTAAGARAEPDGHTVTLVASPAVLAMHLMPRPGFDLMKDFVPVGRINELFNVLVVNAKLEARSFAEFKDHVAKNPGRFNFATAGNATPSDIGGRMVAKEHQLAMTFIPYKGSTGALNAVIAGEADGSILVAGPSLPHIQRGSLRALAVLAPQRTPLLPDVPDYRESGVNVLTGGWTGLAVPRGTPADRVEVLNRALNEALRSDNVAKRVTASGARVLPGTPQDLRQLMQADIEDTGRALAELKQRP